jgi:hypothetical protein
MNSILFFFLLFPHLEDTSMDFIFFMRLEPWVWDQVLHTIAHILKNIILFIIPQGLDFHGTLPLIGTYGIEPWDVV